MAFLLNSQAQVVSGKKCIIYPKHHGTGHTEARSPMQLHRLHRLKAGPESACAHVRLLVTGRLFASRVTSAWAQAVVFVKSLSNQALLFCPYYGIVKSVW